KGIEAGEQPLESESDARGAFGTVDGVYFSRAAVALDCTAQSDCQGDDLTDAVGFLVADGGGLEAAASEQFGDGLGQLLTLLLGCDAEVPEGAVELCLPWRWREPGQQEPVAHRPDDGAMGIDHFGCCKDESDLVSLRAPLRLETGESRSRP